ncbi:TPA: hypothetical protein ACQOK2_001680 [Streptococcus pyogenes]|uniref:hypothetical protein n=1 Tax=Streptococcus pyogenes TaxID=1314 RepID=UPI00109BFD35|nr:hypothetical protein [Streptococcus pyogenes]VHA75532.1 Uncharacterised protein [Streptococcus pyogenes]VHF68797.1 Uncharacterised protein [Streptococcus pyogenes]VHM41556.1 Uncharacterised protein [Streptococcus pyogenes]HEP1680783.1 hypothetical protein [Streptococcus pyogenes]HEP2150208.1 hypothetical protein [Streptococcus pyogenes]
MKTKSKRFLNLATLCLALLGTTLLMARPVKAEIVTSDHRTSDVGHTTESSGNYDDVWKQGYDDGRRDGSQSDAPEMNASDLDEKAKAKARDGKHGEGYSDGYQSGYSQASYETHHPIMAAIGSFLSWLWDLFTEEQ